MSPKKSPHDIKINIRTGFIFETFQIKIQVLYFLLYFCFSENSSINNSYHKCQTFLVKLEKLNAHKLQLENFFLCEGKIKGKYEFKMGKRTFRD